MPVSIESTTELSCNSSSPAIVPPANIVVEIDEIAEHVNDEISSKGTNESYIVENNKFYTFGEFDFDK